MPILAAAVAAVVYIVAAAAGSSDDLIGDTTHQQFNTALNLAIVGIGGYVARSIRGALVTLEALRKRQEETTPPADALLELARSVERLTGEVSDAIKLMPKRVSD